MSSVPKQEAVGERDQLGKAERELMRNSCRARVGTPREERLATRRVHGGAKSVVQARVDLGSRSPATSKARAGYV